MIAVLCANHKSQPLLWLGTICTAVRMLQLQLENVLPCCCYWNVFADHCLQRSVVWMCRYSELACSLKCALRLSVPAEPLGTNDYLHFCVHADQYQLCLCCLLPFLVQVHIEWWEHWLLHCLAVVSFMQAVSRASLEALNIFKAVSMCDCAWYWQWH